MTGYYRGLDAVPAGFGPSAVTVGKFDGVHLGHVSIVGELASLASARGLVPTVVTFDRNPLALLAPERCPRPLLGQAWRAELLGVAGAEAVVEIRFDQAFAAQSAEDFVRKVIVEATSAKLVLVGRDFSFGARASGDVALLRELGERDGFEVVLIEDVALDEGRISSTRIRAALDAGEVELAARMLGRLPAVRGAVRPGDARGRELGYRTANIDPDLDGYLPRDGIYAGWVVLDGVRYPSAISLGNNPTFDGVPEHQLEAHLIDVELDLYGRVLQVEFAHFLRPMARFDSVEELMAQIGDDDRRSRELLGLRAADWRTAE